MILKLQTVLLSLSVLAPSAALEAKIKTKDVKDGGGLLPQNLRGAEEENGTEIDGFRVGQSVKPLLSALPKLIESQKEKIEIMIAEDDPSYNAPSLKSGKDIGERCSDDSECDSQVCETDFTSFFFVARCRECRVHANCASRVTQPPAGEWGEPFCLENACVAHPHGESMIPKEGYPTWIPSETLDNVREYHKITMPRHVLHVNEPKPVFDQVYYFDLNEQEDSFNMGDVRVSDTHIQIPSFSKLHAGYSKSYHQYGEHETGITTLIAVDNDVSVITPIPKAGLVEKTHTLTYDGVTDTSRGDYIRERSSRDLSQPWGHTSWLVQAVNNFIQMGVRETIPAQIEAGVDQALVWQLRRYASSYQDDGSVNPDSSAAWAAHAAKAKQAIEHAKNPQFEREFLKSEQHCHHFEQGDGVDASDTHITLPLGRPFTSLNGQMVNAPVHYLGFNAGHITAHYDETENILQLYYQAHSSSRQYTDVQFPGPYESGLFVSPVAEGSDYAVDPNTDGRYDSKIQLSQPFDDFTASDERDFSLWARPKSDTCAEDIENESFWEEIDLDDENDNVYDALVGNVDLLNGVIRGMPCADQFMSSDYGPGTNHVGTNEYGVWAHLLLEIRDVHTKEVGLADWWNNWECFYGNKDPAICRGG